jgi:ABC-type antimicrobial peptide transport system permease subunit
MVRVQGALFLVIGIVTDNERTTTYASQLGEDLAIFLPYTSLLKRLGATEALQIRVRVGDVSRIQVAKAEIRNVLEARRGRRTVEFRVVSELESLETYMRGQRTVARLLALVAGLALFVGGTGIMNVMLVSIAERVHEIGVRIAIGTRRSRLLRQFLLESIMLTSIGGAIGAFFGFAAAHILTYLNGWPTRVTVPTMLLALGCSVAVGLASGYYPARRAADLDPIEALRKE